MKSSVQTNVSGKRKCSSKVKNGCLNCKLQRRKCDILKPNCGLCTSTKKDCIYASPFRDVSSKPISSSHSHHTYPNQGLALKLTPPSYSPLSHLGQPHDMEGRSHFYYFQHKAMLEISSLLPLEFWNSYILPLSSESPSIQYSIVALAAQHREFLGETLHSDSRYALLAYGHAIQNLNERLTGWDRYEEKGRVVEEVLITCLLFICFNLLRGEGENDAAALMHLEAGLKIYGIHCNCLWEAPGNMENSLIFQVLSTLRRLDLQAAFYLGPYQLKSVHFVWNSQDSGIQNKVPAFRSISEAGECLEKILLEAYHFLRSTAEPLKYASTSLTSHQVAAAQRDQFLQNLDHWFQIFKRIQPRNETESIQAAKLSISHSRAKIALSVCLSPSETAYDAHIPVFMHIIDSAEFILNFQQGRPLFDLEMCLVEVLYYAALKCRDGRIRWKAVELLGQTGKEGVWEGRIMSFVAKFVLGNEEGKRGLVERGEVIEEHRVHGTEVDVRRERREIGVKCSKKRYVSGRMGHYVNECGRSEDCVWEFLEALLKY